MNSDGSGMFQGTKCGSCGGFVGRRTKEQVIEQDQDKGYGICPKCEEQNEKQEVDGFLVSKKMKNMKR